MNQQTFGEKFLCIVHWNKSSKSVVNQQIIKTISVFLRKYPSIVIKQFCNEQCFIEFVYNLHLVMLNKNVRIE